jgi:hypothetical protein
MFLRLANWLTLTCGENEFHNTSSCKSTSGESSLAQKAEIGIRHHIAPSSIKKWNSGLRFWTDATPKTTTGNFRS